MTTYVLLRNAQIATMTPDKPYGLVENGVLVISDGRVKWVGAEKELPVEYEGLPEYMLKMSSLVSVIGLTELTRRADELVVSQYRPLEIYTFLVLEYFLLIICISSGVRWMEKRLKTV